jgi:hypothetical protein
VTPDRTITNRKVASLDPTWRAWRGVSVLFDNPGATPGHRLEDATAAGAPEQRLYDDLAVLVDASRPAQLRSAYGFCPLPRTTYHVTVCDGPNEDELASATGPHVATAGRLLAGLPDNLADVTAALTFAGWSDLLDAVARNPVTLTAEAVMIWGSVLAVQLVPRDDASHAALGQIIEAREAVVEALHANLGIAVKPWRPHVSLGYFANLDGARDAAQRLPRWNEWLAAAEAAPITYRSAALYGFTDMVSFFRVGS